MTKKPRKATENPKKTPQLIKTPDETYRVGFFWSFLVIFVHFLPLLIIFCHFWSNHVQQNETWGALGGPSK